MKRNNERGSGVLLLEMLVVAVIMMILAARLVPNLAEIHNLQLAQAAENQIEHVNNVQVALAVCAAESSPPAGCANLSQMIPAAGSITVGSYTYTFVAAQAASSSTNTVTCFEWEGNGNENVLFELSGMQENCTAVPGFPTGCSVIGADSHGDQFLSCTTTTNVPAVPWSYTATPVWKNLRAFYVDGYAIVKCAPGTANSGSPQCPE